MVPMRLELYEPSAADLMYRFLANVTSTMKLEQRLRSVHPTIKKRQ